MFLDTIASNKIQTAVTKETFVPSDNFIIVITSCKYLINPYAGGGKTSTITNPLHRYNFPIFRKISEFLELTYVFVLKG